MFFGLDPFGNIGEQTINVILEFDKVATVFFLGNLIDLGKLSVENVSFSILM